MINGTNTYLRTLTVGTHAINYLDSHGDGYDNGGYWAVYDLTENENLLGGGPVNGLVPTGHGGTLYFPVINLLGTVNPLYEMKVKWRGSSEFVWTGTEAGGGETINMNTIAGTSGSVWINEIAAVTVTNAVNDNAPFAGI